MGRVETRLTNAIVSGSDLISISPDTLGFQTLMGRKFGWQRQVPDGDRPGVKTTDGDIADEDGEDRSLAGDAMSLAGFSASDEVVNRSATDLLR